jgi:hypothetical protein
MARPTLARRWCGLQAVPLTRTVMHRHFVGPILLLLAVAVAPRPGASQPPRAEALRVTQLLRAGAADVDVMELAAPAPYAELSARFVEALRRDREWSTEYVRAAPEGEPLPYHPRLGLSEAEYREMLALTDSMRLRSLGSAPLVVQATARGWRLDGDSTLPDLTGIEIDTVAGVVRTPFGEAPGPAMHPATPEQKVTGPVDRFVWKHKAFSADMRDGVSIDFSLGRLRESGRTLLYYDARRIAGGALTGRVSRMLLMDAPSADSTASTGGAALDGRFLTPGVDTMYTVALRAEGPDTVGVGVQTLTRSAGPGGEQWLQVFTWTAKDGSVATDSLVMDYRTLRPLSQARHAMDGNARVTYSGARVRGVVQTTSEAASPFDTTFDRPVYSSAGFDLHARALPLPASYATEVYLFNPFPSSRGPPPRPNVGRTLRRDQGSQRPAHGMLGRCRSTPRVRHAHLDRQTIASDRTDVGRRR